MPRDVDVGLPAPKRPVDAAVLGQRDHDIVWSQARGLGTLSDVSVERSLLFIAAAREERDFDDASTLRAHDAAKRRVDDHVFGLEAAQELKEVVWRYPTRLHETLLDGGGQRLQDLAWQVFGRGDSSERQVEFLRFRTRLASLPA